MGLTDVIQSTEVWGHMGQQKEESDNWLLYHPWSPARHRQIREVPWRYPYRQPLMECPWRPSYKEGQQQSSVPEKKPVQLSEPHQSAKLPNLSQAHPGTRRLLAQDPYTQSSINKLEGIQGRAARFVTVECRTSSTTSRNDFQPRMGNPATKTPRGWWWCTRLHMALLTSQLQLIFIQPLSVHESTPCAIYHHTVEPTLTGASSSHQGYAFWTSCRSLSSQRQHWSLQGHLQGRAARSLLDAIEECFILFLNRFNHFLTTPQMHLVNIQCNNAPEKALHFTEKEKKEMFLNIFSHNTICHFCINE